MGSLSLNKNTTEDREMSSTEVISSLRGKVIHKIDRKDDLGEPEIWSPYNANLHMQGIKVLVKEPVPAKVQKGGDAFEDTMLLLEMIKERKKKESKRQKEELIREMAMEKKRKLSAKSNNQYLKLTF